MRDSRYAIVLMLFLLAVVCVFAGASDDDDVPPEFVLNGIKGGIERSPDHYVAALVRVDGPATCDNMALEGACEQPNKILTLFAAKGADVLEGDIIRMLGQTSIGSRYLVFAVPVKGAVGVYGGAFMSGRTDEATQRIFVEALAKAGATDARLTM